LLKAFTTLLVFTVTLQSESKHDTVSLHVDT
jgi:hypothetical protein